MAPAALPVFLCVQCSQAPQPWAEHAPGTSFGCLVDASAVMSAGSCSTLLCLAPHVSKPHAADISAVCPLRDCSAPFHLAMYVGKPPAADTSFVKRRRDCSAPFHLAPYVGKPPAAAEAPDALEAQKLLAGMADRGADVAVVECAAAGLDAGRCGSSRLLPAGQRW